MSCINFVPLDLLEPASDWVLIGRGHFGDVFKTKHKRLHLHVAVKKLKNPSCHLEELLDEAEKIRHAADNLYVIKVFGIVKAPPCIIMQWMENGCLGTLMERVKEIPWPFKYRIVHDVALGMNWLHSLSPPLLHLDLKPRNILLNDALHIQIADFGLSRITSSSTALGATDLVGGTLAYMPPEAFQEGYTPSTSTDIYSFAILSAVVLKGEDPYPVDESSLIRISITEGQRPSFKSLENIIKSVKNLDTAIAFTKCCWDTDKQKRPSFGECCNQWEKIKSAYTDKEIKESVKAVQNMMDCTDSPSSAPDVQQSASVPNTKDMSDMINKMKTIHIAEAPSPMQGAASSTGHRVHPVRLPLENQPRTNAANNGPSTSYYRTGSQPIRNPQSSQGQVNQPGPVGHDQRANSSFHRTGNVRNPQTVQRPYIGLSRQAYTSRAPNNFPTCNVFQTPFFQQGIQHFMPHSFVSPNFQVSQQPANAFVNVSINSNTGPVQIGDNNDMSFGVPNHSQNMFAHHSVRSRPPSGPSPTQMSNIQISGNTGPVQIGDNNRMYLSPEPTHPTPVSLPAEDGQSLSDVGRPTPETGRQTDQPLERATFQDTTPL